MRKPENKRAKGGKGESCVETMVGRGGRGVERYPVFLGESIITMSNGSSHRPLP